MLGRTGKLYFNENEAARILGVSVENFRTLLKQQILDRDEDATNASQTTFHAADILLLKMFSRQTLSLKEETRRSAEPPEGAAPPTSAPAGPEPAAA